MPRLATLAEVSREMSHDAASPATRAPTLAAATACPKALLLSPSSSTISGKRGTRLANPRPLARNTRLTPARARMSSGLRLASEGLLGGVAECMKAKSTEAYRDGRLWPGIGSAPHCRGEEPR